MAYDETALRRLRRVLSAVPGVTEKPMFGGVSFLINGHLACGLTADLLVVRLGPGRYEGALSQPHTREMDFTGRPMRGWVYVEPDGYADDADLEYWVRAGLDHASSLDPK